MHHFTIVIMTVLANAVSVTARLKLYYTYCNIYNYSLDILLDVLLNATLTTISMILCYT